MGRPRQIKSASIGDRFGKWVVVGEEISGNSRKAKTIPCECDCGTNRNVVVETLIKGTSTSCGCIPKVKTEYPHIGDRFGKWEVIGEVDT